MCPDLSLEFAGVRFPNPFTLAPAPSTDNAEMVARAFDAGWGGAVLKTTSVETEEVNLAYPMLAAIDFHGRKVMGLENIDLISERHIGRVEQDVRELKAAYPDRVVGASIMGARKEDWQELVVRLEEAGVDFIECSFSCPHGMPEKGMGSTIGQDATLTERTARWVKEASRHTPVVIKVTPLVPDIVHIAQAVKRSGADAVCAINTVKCLIGVISTPSFRTRMLAASRLTAAIPAPLSSPSRSGALPRSPRPSTSPSPPQAASPTGATRRSSCSAARPTSSSAPR